MGKVKRKPLEPFQEVGRAVPTIKEHAPKVKRSREASAEEAHQQPDLSGEKKAATKILDQLLGGGAPSHAGEKRSAKEEAGTGAQKKRKEAPVSSNWEKLRSQLPPPSHKKPMKPLIPAPAPAPAAAPEMPTTVTFNSASEETRYCSAAPRMLSFSSSARFPLVAPPIGAHLSRPPQPPRYLLQSAGPQSTSRSTAKW